MCDYSLTCVENRLAQAGEELVVHRFSTGVLGLASIVDLARRRDRYRRMSFWSRVKRFCEVPFSPCLLDHGVPAVCMPPGTRLQLRDLSKKFQRKYGCAEVEEVVFTQTSADPYTFRDAVVFGNGALVLFQRLKQRQRVRILSLSSSEDVEPIRAERVFSR